MAFGSIPESTLLTLALDTQHAWQAFPKQCLHDLDNIRLADLKPAARKAGVDAVFELSNIIVEGHASETRTGHPPRGLQIELSDGRHYTNTLVMANLGYHQLKANPGLWAYKIRGGRSSEVFEIDNIKGGGAVGSALNSSINHILVTSFEGVTLIPQFRRKPGMDGVDLLDENAEQTSGNIKAKATEVLSKWRSQYVIMRYEDSQPIVDTPSCAALAEFKPSSARTMPELPKVQWRRGRPISTSSRLHQGYYTR